MTGTADAALGDLHDALAAGTLRIITATPAPGARTPSADPADYVQHAVVHLAGPDAAGLVVATSAEGDTTIGAPHALLRRLTRWSRES